ncbi:universal stress protein [Spirosoma litoris]
MKKIVFPTDFSKETGRVLPLAAQLAKRFNADLHLVHVLSPPLISYPPRIPAVYDQYQQASEAVDNAFEELKALSCLENVRTHTHILPGADPVDLLKDVHLADADLLVMASSGATGLKEVLWGSNAEELIREAPMPVLVVKKPPTSTDIKTVVFASDFLEHYDSSIPFLKTLLSSFEYPIVHLIYVNTLSNFVPTHEIKARMEAFTARYHFWLCTLNQQDEFDVETGLLNFAKEKNADLIILGTHGRHGLRHLLQGSIAEDVANHASIPVLTLPLRSSHKAVEAINPTLL